jgi:hypothetical chaperone protein
VPLVFPRAVAHTRAMTSLSIGLDFGTSNSAVAAFDRASGSVRLAQFPSLAGLVETFRSVLYFHPERRGKAGDFVPLAGPQGIDQYLADDDGQGRLIQSMKSYLADHSFDATSVFGRTMTLTELLSVLLVKLREQAEADLGPLGRRLAVGRPVRFSQADDGEDDAFAVKRLSTALERAGWDDVTLIPEPVAAAHFYERRLDHDEIVLVGDFGGGTSDFTLAKVGPTRLAAREDGVLATSGVGLAGDALDARIVDNVVAPALGKGSTYRSMFGKDLDVPVWLFHKLRRWHHLSFLKTKSTMALFDEMQKSSSDRDAIEAFRDLVDNEEGYRLYRAVESVKIALSKAPTARFFFEGSSLSNIERVIERADFEGWIAEETAAMEAAVDDALARASLDAKDVSRVFLTGGTSFVPAVRRIFESRFADRIETGGEMVSVASGLALLADEWRT